MDWVKAHYTQQSRLFGRATISDRHREIAKGLHQWFESWQVSRGNRVLELGAGACGLAAAMTEFGYDVWAVEFNPADVELAKQLVKERNINRLHIVEADFYEVQLEGKFDFIYYWDGFGVGDDEHQRRLLTRIGNEWLGEDGLAIIDIFSPWNWQRRVGEVSEFRANDGSFWTREIQFDPLHSRFRDVMRVKDGSQPELSQTIRVYSLQDFLLLIEKTGTQVARFYLDFETRISLDVLDDRVSNRMMKSNGYFVHLMRAKDRRATLPNPAST